VSRQQGKRCRALCVRQGVVRVGVCGLKGAASPRAHCSTDAAMPSLVLHSDEGMGRGACLLVSPSFGAGLQATGGTSQWGA
jgi:hypothetical protein